MSTLLADKLQVIANSSTGAQPAMALISLSGEPTYCLAWKGPNSTDAVELSGVAAISGASSDAAPALAAANTYLANILYLAWKLPGATGVKVMQCRFGEDGFPVTQSWTSLAAEPAATTDAAPALSAGPSGELYLVWKNPGSNAAISWSVYNSSTWSTPAPIPMTETDLSPAVSALNPIEAGAFCLAFTGSGSKFPLIANVVPGATSLSLTYPVGYITDAAPAVAPGPTANSFYLVWKQSGAATLAFAPVTGNMVGDVTTLPQVATGAAPAAVCWSNGTTGFGAELIDGLILAWQGKTTSDVVQGWWTIPDNPAPPPAAGLGSNSNYFLYSACNNLTGVSVSVTITQNMLSSNGFGFQLNANSPSGKTCTWQQYAITVDTSGNLSGVVDNYAAAGELIRQWDAVCTLPTPTLTAGYVLTITLQQNPQDGTVTGVIYAVQKPDGTHVPPVTRSLTSLSLYHQPGVMVTTTDLAPIVALQLDIVGYDGGQTAKLSSGEGTITYKAKEVLTPFPTEPPCAAPDNGTGETANTFYGVLPAGGGMMLTQGFAASAAVPMIHRHGATHRLRRRG